MKLDLHWVDIAKEVWRFADRCEPLRLVLDPGAGRQSSSRHAYLHRKEGDLSNAGYGYRRAKQPVASDALEAEWERIAIALLARS